MKTALFRGMISIAVLAACAAPAELIVYKGTAPITYIGQDQTLLVNFKMFLVVDHDTANVAELLYANGHGTKLYSTGTETNLHVVDVTGANGRIYTALSRQLSQCDIDSGSTSEGVFVRGISSPIPVSTNTTISFPKTLTSEEHGYDPDLVILVNGTLSVSFDKKDTLISNTAGDDLAAALARLVTYVQSLGYTEAPQAARQTVGIAAQAARIAAPLSSAP